MTNSFEEVLRDGTNVWHATNSYFAEGRALYGILHHLKDIIPRTTSGTLQILTNSKNTIKWTSLTYTASRASKPGGKI